jgi:hypothetical protein
MKTFSNDRELYLAYRLGEIPESEKEPIEDLMLTDDEFSDRMQEAENDLLDDYHAGRLKSAERVRVERVFTRDELRPSLSLPSRTTGGHAIVPSKPARTFSSAFRLACVAAATVLVVLAGWVIAARHHSGAASPAPAARTTPASSTLPQDTGKSSTSTAVSSSHLPGETAVFLLAPAITRGGSTAHLELHPATRTVMVQWLVPSELAGGTFSLLVQRNGKQVAMVPASNVLHVTGSDIEGFSLPRAVFSSTGPHVHYVFLVRKLGIVPTTEAEFAVNVTGDFNH